MKRYLKAFGIVLTFFSIAILIVQAIIWALNHHPVEFAIFLVVVIVAGFTKRVADTL